MAEQYLMGIDIGTQSTRPALLDLDGKVGASTSTAQDMQTPRPGWAEQDPQIWFDAPGAPYPKLENEKETPETIDYDTLLQTWASN